MIILKVILMLAAAFALYWQIKIKKVFPAIIMVGMIAGMIVLYWISKAFEGNLCEHYLDISRRLFIYWTQLRLSVRKA